MIFGNKPLLREEYWGWEGGGYVDPNKKSLAQKKQEKIASQNSNDLLVKFLTQMLPIAEVEKTLTLQEELKLLKESEKLKNHEGSKFRIKL